MNHAKGDASIRVSLDTVLVVGVTLLITAAPLLSRFAAAVVSIAVGLLTLLAWRNRCRAAAPLGVFCVVCLVLALSGIRYSQLILAVGLLGYAAVVRRTAWLQHAAGWARRGSFGVEVRFLTAGCGLAAAIGLWIWYGLMRPNIDDLVHTFVPAAPLSLLIVGGILFSMANAAVEEGAYRGVILHGLDSTLGPGVAALVLQAIAFGAVHVEGFPRGWVGIGLAAVYGLMMGIIKRRADGMLAPWIAHVLTDVVIAGIVVAVARPNLTLH